MLTDDSRKAGPTSIFAATQEGRAFLPNAAHAGSILLLQEGEFAHMRAATLIRCPDVNEAFGALASALVGHPSRRLFVAGVTGTNGKTSTTLMLYHMWKNAGIAAGVIGTLGVRWSRPDGSESTFDTGYTTPRAPQIQEVLAMMRKDGVSHVAMEVSSEALALGRLAGTRFSAAGFINLTVDHLNFHGDLESYFASKMILFREAAKAGAALAVWTEGEYGGRALAYARLLCDQSAVSAVSAPLDVVMPVPTRFNRINAAVALSLSGLSGDARDEAVQSLSTLPEIPGRFNVLGRGGGPGRTTDDRFAVIDYAHTPDALLAVLTETRALGINSLACVFGCGGNRDKSKRPVMGRIASEHCDLAIVTDDNPRTETPAGIRREILFGVHRRRDAIILEIADRRKAIQHGVEWLKSQTRLPAALVVAGKGHEAVQIFADHKEAFSDREETGRAMRGVGL